LDRCHARQRHDADIPSYIISLTGPNRAERRHAARHLAKTGEIVQLRPKVNWDRFNDEHRCHWMIPSKQKHLTTYGERRQFTFQCRHLRQAPSIFCRHHQNFQLSLFCTYFCKHARCKTMCDKPPMVDTQITRAAFYTSIWCFQELKLPRDIVRYKLIPLLLASQ
jgi:hypothetical protein